MHTLQITQCDLSPDIFTDRREYLKAVNHGIPGGVVRWAVNTIPDQRESIVNALGTTSGNLSRLYQRKTLSKQQSEEMLDILSVYLDAQSVFEDWNIAREWLNTSIPALSGEKPSDLMDTFIGRELVSEALNKIKCGEFT